MSEFVEAHLEQLLPVFELLNNVQLLSLKEVNEFIKRCRNHEYRLQKTVKDPNDFTLYSEYLIGVLELIRMRRKRLKYFPKVLEIDGAIKSKIADIYRRCTERFQGRADIWRKRLDYLKSENMFVRCSRAFFRALQVMGSDVSLRAEAARWEFFNNKSIDNARLHLQMALRNHADSHLLWRTLFRLEVLNVRRLIERRNVLTGKDSKEEGQEVATEQEEVPSDAVMNLELAEIVADQALCSDDVHDKNALLFDLWRTAFELKQVANRLEVLLYERLWKEGNVSEESYMAKLERHKEEMDRYDVLDEAIARLATPKMIRHYIAVCEERILMGDVFAGSKLREMYELMDEKGLASIDDYEKLMELESDDPKREDILERALQRFESSNVLWSRLIRIKMADDNASAKDIQKLFNKAERVVNKNDMLSIYQLAIDWAIAHSPSTVDAIFKRAILTSPSNVSSQIKCIRLRYLRAAHPDNATLCRKEYAKMCASPPNAMSVHRTFIELEQEHNGVDSNLIVNAYENSVADFGYENYECWIDYARHLLKHNPTAISPLYQRAIVCIPDNQSDAFATEWTKMLQEKEPELVKTSRNQRKKVKRRLKAQMSGVRRRKRSRKNTHNDEQKAVLNDL